MRPEFIEPRREADKPFDLRAFNRDMVLRGIEWAADDPSEMKERIFLARQCGFLSDDETRAWIVKHGLEAA